MSEQAAANPNSSRFRARYNDDELYVLVSEVIRAGGLGPKASTRKFDAARHLVAKPGIPSAQPIATRLRRPWSKVVEIALGVEGAPSPHRAVITATRSTADLALDERNVLFALLFAAGRRNATSLTPADYERERDRRLQQADREQDLRTWELLLPTVGQIVRLAGSWDLALRIAGAGPPAHREAHQSRERRCRG